MNYLFYLVTTVIWSSTWFAIKFQLGEVAPTWSIVYRFALAALILLLFCLVRKKQLQFSRKQHILLAMQGSLMFSGNYILFYLGSEYLISGLVAVVFASLVIMNIVHSRIIFRTAIAARVALGALLGMVGLCVVFWSEIKTLTDHSHLHYVLLGFTLSFVATIVASWGNMIATYNQRTYQLPIIQSNAIAMVYGTLFAACIAIALGEKPNFDWHLGYISSLVYLSIFGTVFAFGAYVTLLKRIGPERAAYTFVVIPIIALIISTFFENFKWLPSTLVGVVLVLMGNYLVLSKKM